MKQVIGFERVRATREETADWKAKHGGRPPSVYRMKCTECGTRIWGSGLAIGAHRRAHDRAERAELQTTNP